MSYVFVVNGEEFVFDAPNAGSAMEMCNRQVIDRLDLHPMAWFESGSNGNRFVMQQGNFYD